MESAKIQYSHPGMAAEAAGADPKGSGLYFLNFVNGRPSNPPPIYIINEVED
jgi:hypothetical protein